MTLVLSFDCAVSGLGLAVVRDKEVLAVHREDGREQAARLLPAIARLLRAAEVDRRALSMIAVTVGPGSFTGVRVGLAAARGLAIALDVPLAGFSTTTTLLAQAPKGSRLALAAIDSQLGDWFCALDEDDQAPFLATTAALAERLKGRASCVIGPQATSLAAELDAAGLDVEAETSLPDPVVLARLAIAQGAAAWRARNRDEGLPRPLYLRGVNITLPDGQRRTVD
ncbi:tRNA (adenosine(37)-N6)-threonylcarbamoyltransferase complex dimerization subunit type 1 TsaB [Enhydrobacter sp.]|jgi:tRNA threonylcarbamoyladenosine biosynthesis protein TsaB|uniref:tRNA (adenosine(37)-N6)-threonylcarbamoyltransferase complex dimerization subunit type 1 TsaB n=1 Tax=Enhydrobacter sp. TaxID=1894999 RepID=UPI00260B0307|nr:tRNA (adenosine(37)-N6)-threonylcarbamoyltransferase complex dimerization subunit type 1 TsaB [Enhydrobacter sp.]WIM11433.1 MAG: tRNA threonylcarbamoyladenosine biosynthesis protein TsaB [Enhydrobacter sp.]